MSRAGELARATILLAMLAGSMAASAQYSGTTGMPGGSAPGGTSRNYGYKFGAKTLGIGAGAAAGATLLYMGMKHHTVKGCISPDGTKFTDKSGHRYRLSASSSAPAGELVSVKSKKFKDRDGETVLNIIDVKKDWGRCEQQLASAPQ